MANFNKVILAGNLTRDPQLSYLPSNTPVCEFGMAINRQWRGQDGQQREEVCFVDLRCYGRQAEVLNQYMKKGQPLLVDGRLKYDQWEGKDGGRRSKLYVIAERFQFLGGPGGGSRDGGGGARPAREYGPPRGAAPQEEYAPADHDAGPAVDDMPPAQDGGTDEVPF